MVTICEQERDYFLWLAGNCLQSSIVEDHHLSVISVDINTKEGEDGRLRVS